MTYLGQLYQKILWWSFRLSGETEKIDQMMECFPTISFAYHIINT